MPAILEKSAWDQWLHPRAEDLDEQQGLLMPAKKEDGAPVKDVGKGDKYGEYLLESNSQYPTIGSRYQLAFGGMSAE